MTILETKPLTPAQQAQEQARQAYRDSLKAQNPISGVELGNAFKRSERWGRDRIAEVKVEASSPVLSPTLPETEPTPPSLPPVTAETAEADIPDSLDETEKTGKPRWWKRQRQAGAAEPGRTMPKPQKRSKASKVKREPRQVPHPAAMAERTKVGSKPRGRLVAWTAMVVGIVVSMGANVGHIVFVIGPTLPDGPSMWSMALAAFWPLSLFLAIEVITKVSWPSSWAYNLARFGAVGAIALVAGWVSYWHMHGLLSHWGEDPLSAYVGPIGVDGLVVIGGIALAAIRQVKSE